ncbi:MAG: hypothetical protein WC551_13490 [Patescibacteria group bacterium]
MDKDKILVGAVVAVGIGLLIWKGTSQGSDQPPIPGTFVSPVLPDSYTGPGGIVVVPEYTAGRETVQDWLDSLTAVTVPYYYYHPEAIPNGYEQGRGALGSIMTALSYAVGNGPYY